MRKGQQNLGELQRIPLSKTSSALTTNTDPTEKGHIGDMTRREETPPCYPLRTAPSTLLWNTPPTFTWGNGVTYSQNSMTGDVAFSVVTFRDPLVFWNSTQFSIRGSRGRKKEKGRQPTFGTTRENGMEF